MGGLGSGRRGGSGRDTTEDYRSIDANDLQRSGCLRPGWAGLWRWMQDGEQLAWINLRAERDRLHLAYRVQFGGGEWEDVTETVRTFRVACHYGGMRTYFICPGAACGRRVAKLYGAGRDFLCRHCYQLAYASQSERTSDRMLRRANKIRERLGSEPGMASRFPPRPTGMWRTTYARLRKQAFDAEGHADNAFARRANRLLAQIGDPRHKRGFWR